jgi:hypothetical protein
MRTGLEFFDWIESGRAGGDKAQRESRIGGRKELGWGVSVANKFFVFIVHKAWALAHQKGELFVDGPHGHKIIFVVF